MSMIVRDTIDMTTATSSIDVTARGCTDADEKVINIDEYLQYSKTHFENRLNDHLNCVKESHVSDFVLHKTIGMGAFGRVLLVHHKSDDTKCLAMKVMKKEHILRKKHLKYVINEKRFLAAIRHPFITYMKYYTKDLCNLYFVMPFAVGGDLFGLIQKNGLLGELKSKFYSGQMVLALEYLHTMDILYRDLKPENVLIDEQGFIRLTDLGMCKRVETRTASMCGTTHYMAPEIISIKGYGKPVDWWALGVIIYEMVTGKAPFNAVNEKRMFKDILNGNYKIPLSFSPELSDLVKNLIQKDLTKRYGNLLGGVDDIKQHRWFSKTNWLMLFNKQVEAPFVPTYSSLSDTSNFDTFTDEESTTMCNDVDQSYFDKF